MDLLARTNYAAELFDDRNIVEITDPGTPEHRYCLCRNPHSALRETTTRNELLERTRKELDQIAGRKNPALEAVIGARVGQILAKTKMGKYLHWSVNEGRLVWSVDEAAVEAAQALDGCYVIKTTVRAGAMTKAQVVARYKSLGQVEQAFRNMKKVSLEMRPMHHKRDDRIRAHVFLCMLAYYLQWHLWSGCSRSLTSRASRSAPGRKSPRNVVGRWQRPGEPQKHPTQRSGGGWCQVLHHHHAERGGAANPGPPENQPPEAPRAVAIRRESQNPRQLRWNKAKC